MNKTIITATKLFFRFFYVPVPIRIVHSAFVEVELTMTLLLSFEKNGKRENIPYLNKQDSFLLQT